MRTSSTSLPDSFQPVNFGQDTIALFTPLTLPALRGTELGISQYLGQVIHKVAPTWKVIDERQTITFINRNGLADDYVRMRVDAEQSHIVGRDLLRKIGRALEVRYVLQPRLASFSQMMTDRWSFPVLDLLVLQTRSSILRLSMQLWDVESGELLWASLAETNLQSEALSQDPVFLEDAVRVTLASMMADFFNKKTSKYTPLNQFLDNLMNEAIPKSEDTAARDDS